MAFVQNSLRNLLEDLTVEWINPYVTGSPFLTPLQCLSAPHTHTHTPLHALPTYTQMCMCTHTRAHPNSSSSPSHAVSGTSVFTAKSNHTSIKSSICCSFHMVVLQDQGHKYYCKSSLKCRSLGHSPGHPKSAGLWWDPGIMQCPVSRNSDCSTYDTLSREYYLPE